MGVEPSIGSQSPAFRLQTTKRSSIIVGSGGVDCLQGREYIVSPTVGLLSNTGDICVGAFKNGLKHGEGHENFSNGDSYHGEYINGLPEGYGEYIWSDGSNYKGDFKQGVRNGFGIWKKNNEKNCEAYRGHYLLDRKSGYGVYIW